MAWGLPGSIFGAFFGDPLDITKITFSEDFGDFLILDSVADMLAVIQPPLLTPIRGARSPAHS